MRVALVLVVMATMTTPSQASPSCMNKSEARHQFGSVHIYWHGLDHCWDATPSTRRSHVARVERKSAPRKLQKEPPPNWRDARSELMAGAGPSQSSSERQSQSSTELVDLPDTTITRPNWSERWVDVAQVGPVSLPKSEPAPIPVSPISEHPPESGAASFGLALIVVGSMLLVIFVGLRFRSGDWPIGVIFAAVQRRMYY